VLWIEQARRHDKDVKVLSHAANFFRLSDKERAVSLLRQAQSAEPNNREWPARIAMSPRWQFSASTWSTRTGCRPRTARPKPKVIRLARHR